MGDCLPICLHNLSLECSLTSSLNLLLIFNTDWVGDQIDTLLREYFAIPDSNMFVTCFVASAILEASGLDMIDITPDHAASLESALDAVISFRDKNRMDGIPVYVFWPQINVNGTW